MDAVRVSALRESLAGTGWLESTRYFATALRHSVTRRSAAGLLLVGTERYEPWHLAAHLDAEAALCGVSRLSPILLRHQIPAGAPAHLSYRIDQLARAPRGATVLVVAPHAAGDRLLDGVWDARRAGVTVLALDAGDRELSSLAHERLTVPAVEPEPFDLVQHLVSSAAGTASGARSRLARLAELLAGPPLARW